jgi:DNA-3-methyladenine glycosylase
MGKRVSERSLPVRFYARPVARVARDLLGRWLVHDSAAGRCVGRIVETEAYDESDPASHSYAGPTTRNQAMFGPGGHAYVYRSYGVHWCVNVSVGQSGKGSAVLIRALEPVEGHDLMRKRRLATAKVCRDRDLARGPGRVCQAMGIGRGHNGEALVDGPLRIVSPSNFRKPDAMATTRVGISKGVETLWRFKVIDNSYVSR